MVEQDRDSDIELNLFSQVGYFMSDRVEVTEGNRRWTHVYKVTYHILYTTRFPLYYLYNAPNIYTIYWEDNYFYTRVVETGMAHCIEVWAAYTVHYCSEGPHFSLKAKICGPLTPGTQVFPY